MHTLFLPFIDDQSRVTAIEYGLIAALIAVAIIVAVTTVGTDLTATFTSIGTALAGAASAPQSEAHSRRLPTLCREIIGAACLAPGFWPPPKTGVRRGASKEGNHASFVPSLYRRSIRCHGHRILSHRRLDFDRHHRLRAHYWHDDFDLILWAYRRCFLVAPAPRQRDLANSPLSGSSMFAVKALHARREIICGGAPPVPPGDPLRLPRAIIRVALEWTLKDHA
jgi:pilus assembly protein Flp/PilA